MNNVSREFSSALFSIAVEENKVELFEEQLALLKTVFEENPDYAILLSSPNITKEEKDSLLEEAFGLVLSEHLLSFLGVLSEQNKIFILHDCIEDFFSLALNYRNVTTAKITSAVELSEEQKSRLLKKLEALTDKKVSMSFEINPQLIGGLTLEVDGKVIDASLLNQIRDIKEVIVK
jgi:F-type H+-transporting ATPase subunit delta